MTYKELLLLYKNQELPKEQREQIEKEIEKQEAINEYLFDNEQVPEFSELEFIEEKDKAKQSFDEKRFLKMIKKSIRRAFLKLGIGVGVAAIAVVLAVTVFINNVLPTIIEGRYYNPAHIVGIVEETKNETNKMTLDTAVYTELFNPGYYRIKVNVKNEGGGNYDIHIPQKFSENGQFRDVYGTVEKGKLNLFGENIYKAPYKSVFATEETEGLLSSVAGNGAAGDTETAKRKLEDLNESDYYVGFVTLDKVMTYDEFVKWCEATEVSPRWSAMCRQQEPGEYVAKDIIGFNVISSSGALGYEREEYPYLVYNDLMEVVEEFPEFVSSEYMEIHVKSMLGYMADNEDFCNMVGSAFPQSEYERFINSIDEYGIHTYGFAVVTQKSELLRISELEGVQYVCTELLR